MQFATKVASFSSLYRSRHRNLKDADNSMTFVDDHATYSYFFNLSASAINDPFKKVVNYFRYIPRAQIKKRKYKQNKPIF